MRVYVDGIGILGPGFSGWPHSRVILADQDLWVQKEVPNPMPSVFSPNERRRCSETVRWSVSVAQEALEKSGFQASAVATVFACSDGDGAILHCLCETLMKPDPLISPTLFHQSVHNAPAGYWSIVHDSLQPSTSLSCYDHSFGGGLLETSVQIESEKTPVLLVAYDVPAPQPLYAARPIPAPFAVAMMCTPDESARSLGKLEILLEPFQNNASTSMSNPSLEKLRTEIPSARALPLMAAIATGERSSVVLEYQDTMQLTIGVTPIQSESL